jgi:hypothetical protein
VKEIGADGRLFFGGKLALTPTKRLHRGILIVFSEFDIRLSLFILFWMAQGLARGCLKNFLAHLQQKVVSLEINLNSEQYIKS